MEPTLELLMKKKRQAGTDPYNFLSYPTYHTMMTAQQYQEHNANPLMPNQQDQHLLQQQQLQLQQQQQQQEQQAEAREQARQHLQRLREQAAANEAQNAAGLHQQFIQNAQNQDELQRRQRNEQRTAEENAQLIREQRQQQQQRIPDHFLPAAFETPLHHHQTSDTNNPFTPDNLQDFDALSLTQGAGGAAHHHHR